jgi:hypothetical protein
MKDIDTRVIAARMVALTLALPVGGVLAQNVDQCAVYAASLAYMERDSTARIVVYDSTSLATPSFAFHAWTGMGPRKSDTGFVVTDTMLQALRAENRNRQALPDCISSTRKITRVWYDSLRAKFTDREKGWDVFKAAYPDAHGFFILSKVYWLASDGTQALLYVARATHWLAGSGQILFLRKRDGRWRVEAYRAVWVS